MHPDFTSVEEVEKLNGRQLKRLPEWMLASTARTTIRAKRLSPMASLTDIFEQVEMAYRRIGRDEERMAAIRETATGANTMKAIRQYVRYRVDMSHPGAMDEETFDKAFDAAVRRIGSV